MMIRIGEGLRVEYSAHCAPVSTGVIHILMNKHLLGTQLTTGSAMELWCTCENAMTEGHRVFSCIQILNMVVLLEMFLTI